MFRKRNAILFAAIALTMIAGGYFLGLHIGQDGVRDNIRRPNEELGHQTMQSGSMNNITTEDTLLIFQRYYVLCDHQGVEERKAQGTEIGLNRQELGLEFPEWNFYEFSSDRVILTREIENYCSEHFILKDKKGKLIIYMPTQDEERYTSIEETGILTEMLPPEVQDDIRRGLVLDSLEEVEHFIENWES